MEDSSSWLQACTNGPLTVFFFFSSRRRHTRLQGDWSSDVCSSDLGFEELIIDGVNGFLVPRADPESLAEKKIGRASCRERVWNSVGAGSLEKKDGRHCGKHGGARPNQEMGANDNYHSKTAGKRAYA